MRIVHSGGDGGATIAWRLIFVRHGRGTKWPLEYSRKKWFLGPPELPPDIIEWKEQVKQAEMDRVEATLPGIDPPQPRFRGSSHIAVTIPRVYGLKRKLESLLGRREEEEQGRTAAAAEKKTKLDMNEEIEAEEMQQAGSKEGEGETGRIQEREIAERTDEVESRLEERNLDEDHHKRIEEESGNEETEDGDGHIYPARRHRDEKLMDELIAYYRDCAESGVVPERSMGVKMAFKDYAYLFLQSGEDRDIVRGKWGHAHALSHGHRSNRFLGNCLMIMYHRCGYVADAHKVFDEIIWKNVFSWTVLMKGYADYGLFDRAVMLFRQMLARGDAPNEYTLSCVLTCLGALRVLDQGRVVHGIADRMGLSPGVTAGNALISMYGKCGSVADAKDVFSAMQERNVVTWNALIAAHAQNGLYREMESIVPAMEADGLKPNRISFMGMSLAVPAFRDPGASARMIHKRMFDLGLDLAAQTTLVKMYGRCGRVGDAEMVFGGIPRRDVVAWTAMVTSYAQNGYGSRAFECYRRMQLEGSEPNRITLLGVVDACDSLPRCREIRSRVEAAEFDSDTAVKNSLLTRFGKLGSVGEAADVFGGIGRRNLVSWNAMIFALVQHQEFEAVVDAYRRMQLGGEKPDRISFIGVLDGCAMLEDSIEGKRVHRQAMEIGLSKDKMVRNALVNMYGRSSSFAKARQIFETMEEKDIVSWNVVISAAARHQELDQVFALMRRMDLEGVKADIVTFIAAIGACASSGALREGLEIHDRIRAAGVLDDPDRTRKLRTGLVDMYGKCGSFAAAREIFDSIRGSDDVPWTALIAASAGIPGETVKLLREMDLEGVKATSIAYAVLLDALASSSLLDAGRGIHARIDESWNRKDSLLSSALVSMYARCGFLEEAIAVFEQSGSDHRSVALWNTMLAALIRRGLGGEALELSRRMDLEGVKPIETTFVTLMEACCLATDRQRGDEIYNRFISSGFARSAIVDTALVNLHSISGANLKEIRTFFEKMNSKTQVSWSSMISAYARRGLVAEALELLGEMLQLGMEPDTVTFVTLLAGCSYGGLLDEACRCFYSLEHDHGLAPGVEHYRIMVDVLGRAGWLEEAEKMARLTSESTKAAAEEQQGGGAWTSLLSSCRSFGDPERGARAATAVSRQQPERPSSYLILSSIYAEEATGTTAGAGAGAGAGSSSSSWGAATGEITPVKDEDDELFTISKIARMGPRRPGKPDDLR